jgi:hypothetical protein
MTEIIKNPLTSFNNKLIYKQNKYPQCSCGKCFTLFFNALFVAARNSGKTYCMSRIISHYENNTILDENGNKYTPRTIIISPTFEQNRVFTALKSIDEENDVHSEYSESLLQEIMDDIDAKMELVKEYNTYQKVYNKFMKLKHNEIKKLTDNELELLVKHNFENDMEKPPMYITFLLLDDMLGQKAFSSSKRSKLMNYFIKNRHHHTVFMVALQSMKGCPKELRLNSNLFFLGRFANSSMVCDDIYPEISNVIQLKNFCNLYEESLKEKYGALMVDMTGDDVRFLQNLDAVLEYKK